MSEASNPDSTARALGVTFAVAFVCALLVSVVTVNLRPVQQANIEAERIRQLVHEALSGLDTTLESEKLQARMVELASGEFDDSVDPASFDAETAASNPQTSVEIPREYDLARLKRRATHAQVYLLRGNDNSIHTIILPVSGRGYQSVLRAWLLLDGDATSVRALKIYEQGETPGVGSRVEDEDWQAQWRGLPVYDDAGVMRLGVMTRGGAESGEYAKYKVDGISGATRTARGVDGMVRFWLGDFGYGPFLRRIREGQL